MAKTNPRNHQKQKDYKFIIEKQKNKNKKKKNQREKERERERFTSEKILINQHGCGFLSLEELKFE